ncbi:hypothetical protein BDB00DRAFT_869765 [Zychaea mexicana]|uniref:uncharacterized protein n=1 Tax=Zychaea mexicana TaxID=64656 RepID=UPI0022FDCEA6|nr:uncharacterized protein BDB00DRAFT_869765 [Zychaea mexicana]KAI9496131.1 hypothetical protein BDB00DRAFT_869765 [Zychaea mexicana]
MGVQGLWTLVNPAARPVQLETLRNRKMAVDASIWIHQFMRTMRDKEGNALRNGHLLGFFRRLCKLLFYNIKPVFVFDGGAPALKRSTIKERRRRREGISTNLKRTAEKILSAQVKTRVLLEEERKHKGEAEEQVDEQYAYFDELEKNAALENIKQKMKRDQYELPAMPDTTAKPIMKIDPRLATEQELIDFINEYRPSKEDIDSEAFLALPPEIQFEIVRDLGMESRRTSWARLDEMVRQSRTAMDFSKQQIKLLKHRNEMTQRLLQLNEKPSLESNDRGIPTRIAGERSREYMLVKNENIDQGLGWKLPGLSTAAATTVKSPGSEEETKSNLEQQQQEVTEGHSETKQETRDKVKDAIASNPKLAALLSTFDSDEDEEVEEEANGNNNEYEEQAMSDGRHDHKDYSDVNDEDEPLFLNQDVTNKRRSSLMDNMQAYVEDDDEAVNEVIRRIYADDEKEEGAYGTTDEFHKSSPPSAPDSAILDADGMYQLWISRVPDSYIYLHSINDEYKRLLQSAVYEQDIQQLEDQLKRVQKMYGKTSDRDDMGLDALAFQERYITDILRWRRILQQQEHEAQQRHSANAPDAEMSLVDTGYSTHLPEKQTTDRIEKPKESLPLSPSVSTTREQSDSAPAASAVRLDTEKVPTQVQQHFAQDVTMEEEKQSKSPEKRAVVDNPWSPESDNDYVMMDDDDEDDIDIPLVENNTTKEQSATEQLQQQNSSPGKTLPEEISSRHASPPSSKTDQSKATTEPSYEPAEPDKEAETGEIKVLDESKSDESNIDDEQEKVSMMQATVDVQEQGSTVDLEQELQAAQELAAEPYGYNSDEELTGDVGGEETEYARFVSDIANKDIESVRQELHRDMKELNKQQRKEMGNTDDVTNQMVQDIQEMLRLFGIPYVISPMEAEAQCAELARLSLVEGVVTDDSDVFLFGGTRIYKNMFNQQKYVECYIMHDLEREMRLDRSKLVQLAFLLGSDYTDGIPGIGPVAAIEILAEFTKDEDKKIEAPLERFRVWYESGKDENDFQRKLRKKHKDLEIPSDFPSPLVIEAYYHPMVESSQEEFQWGTPQLDMLRLFLMESFTWSEKKADEVLIPVIREMNKRKSEGQQTNIGTFLDTSTGTTTTNYAPHKRKPHKSKRVQSAINRWRKEKDTGEEAPKEQKRKRTRRS